jgi:hypothetical protein
MAFVEAEFRCRHCRTLVLSPTLIPALEILRGLWGEPMLVDCGYRCPAHNAAVGGAPDSAHIEGMAADIADADGRLKAFCTPERLEAAGLYMEDPGATPSWCHLQTRPTSARIFKP